MRDGAAEINRNQDIVRSRHGRQLKLIVLQEETGPTTSAHAGGHPTAAYHYHRRAPSSNGQLLLPARIDRFFTAIYSSEF